MNRNKDTKMRKRIRTFINRRTKTGKKSYALLGSECLNTSGALERFEVTRHQVSRRLCGWANA